MELLAPAGSWDAMRAAILNGADSIYLGGQSFSARQSAENFDTDELKKALLFTHMHGKRLYLAVNTLLDKRELEAAVRYIWEMYREGIDAVIVQDLGLMRMLRQVLPDLPVHASTQMTIHNSEGCQLLSQQGLNRVVLARELSAAEIRDIKEQAPGMELEVFVHGALCYSYSGQCLFSSMVGGRSGNRGRCAQPCRMPYRLLGKENKEVSLGDQQGSYLLSLSDLCLIEHLDSLQQSGVSALKIEGRMKRPEYVAIVTRVYRQALDYLQEQHTTSGSGTDRSDLLKVFNRTFSTGYLFPGSDGLLSSKRPNNRGVLIGRILDQSPERVARIKLSGLLCEDDGVEVWVSRGKTPAVIVKNMMVESQIVKEARAGQVVSIQLNGFASPGDRVFKTHDKKLIAQAQESIKQGETERIPVKVDVTLQPDLPLSITFTDKDGYQATVQTRSPAQVAEKHPLQPVVLTEKLGRLGQTPFILQDLEMSTSEPLTVPFSELNEARREAVAELIKLRKKAYARNIPDRMQFNEALRGLVKEESINNKQKNSRLSVAVSGVEEARAAMQAGAERVYLGLEGLARRESMSCQEVIELGNYARSIDRELVPSLPRIQKPGEIEKWDELARGDFALLAGNLGAIYWCLQRKVKVMSDFGLNVFNPQSLEFMISQGVSGVCLSPELDIKRLQDFTMGDNIEMLVHGDIQLMVSECCIFRQLLGKEKGNCRSFCQSQDMCLEDEKKYRFPVATDANCRFYVYNSRILCLMEYLGRFVKLGVGWLRVEARRSTPESVYKVASLYREAIDQLKAGQDPDLSYYRDRLDGERELYTRGHYLRGVQ